MKLKYSPIMWNPNAAHNFYADVRPDTLILPLSETSLEVDGEVYEFPADVIQFDDVMTQTDGVIIEAHREGGELYVTLRRFYTEDCSAWDTGEYQEVST